MIRHGWRSVTADIECLSLKKKLTSHKRNKKKKIYKKLTLFFISVLTENVHSQKVSHVEVCFVIDLSVIFMRSNDPHIVYIVEFSIDLFV